MFNFFLLAKHVSSQDVSSQTWHQKWCFDASVLSCRKSTWKPPTPTRNLIEQFNLSFSMICGTWEMSSFHAALPYECCLVSTLCAFGWVNQAKLQPPNSLPTNILQSKVKTLQSDNRTQYFPTNPACHTRKLAHHLPCHLKLSFRTQLKTLGSRFPEPVLAVLCERETSLNMHGTIQNCGHHTPNQTFFTALASLLDSVLFIPGMFKCTKVSWSSRYWSWTTILRF